MKRQTWIHTIASLRGQNRALVFVLLGSLIATSSVGMANQVSDLPKEKDLSPITSRNIVRILDNTDLVSVAAGTFYYDILPFSCHLLHGDISCSGVNNSGDDHLGEKVIFSKAETHSLLRSFSSKLNAQDILKISKLHCEYGNVDVDVPDPRHPGQYMNLPSNAPSRYSCSIDIGPQPILHDTVETSPITPAISPASVVTAPRSVGPVENDFSAEVPPSGSAR